MLTQYIINTSDNSDLHNQLRAAIDAGCSWVEIKADASVSDTDISATIDAFRSEIAEKNMVIILADRFELATSIKADGVHIYDTSLPLSRVRTTLEAWPILGVSISGAEDLDRVAGHDIDYLFFSPAFPDGLDTLTSISATLNERGIETPLVAASGMTEANCMQAIEAGANALAIDSSIASPGNLTDAISSFIKKIS